MPPIPVASYAPWLPARPYCHWLTSTLTATYPPWLPPPPTPGSIATYLPWQPCPNCHLPTLTAYCPSCHQPTLPPVPVATYLPHYLLSQLPPTFMPPVPVATCLLSQLPPTCLDCHLPTPTASCPSCHLPSTLSSVPVTTYIHASRPSFHLPAVPVATYLLGLPLTHPNCLLSQLPPTFLTAPCPKCHLPTMTASCPNCTYPPCLLPQLPPTCPSCHLTTLTSTFFHAIASHNFAAVKFLWVRKENH